MKRILRGIYAAILLMATAFSGFAYGEAPCSEITVFEDGTRALSGEVNCNFSVLENKIGSNNANIQKLAVNNVIWVAKEGGDYSSLSAAMNSISDASSSRPYLIRIAPGTYFMQSSQTVKDYVYIRGSGVDVTHLKCINSTNCSSILSFGNVKTRVSDLTVYNSGTGKIGIQVLGSSGQQGCDVFWTVSTCESQRLARVSTKVYGQTTVFI